MRLRAADGELLAPREFFPVAEHCGLMTVIDRWVMERALDTLHEQRIHHPDLRLLVHQGIAMRIQPFLKYAIWIIVCRSKRSLLRQIWNAG